MKRLPRRILSVAALLLLATAALALTARSEIPVAFRTLATLARVGMHLTVPAAYAQSLDFKPMPPESTGDEEGDSGHAGLVIGGPTTLHIKSGDIMRVGSDITIEEDQEVQGDVLAIRGDVNVDGHVQGNVVSMGGDVRLSSTARVDGDVVCMGGKLHEEPGATVGGQRVTALDPTGRHRYTPHTIRIKPDWDDEGATGKLLFHLILLGLVWLLTMIAPGSTGSALAKLKERPAPSLGLGLLIWLLFVPSVIVLVLVVAILCITIIGIPLALIALLGYFVFFALLILWGYAVGAAALGERLLMRRGEAAPSLMRSALAGVIVIGVVAVIGSVFRWLDFLPLMGMLSALAKAIVILAMILLTSMGAGAWMHTEFTTGTLGRWWRGSSGRMRRNPPPPAGPDATPPAGGTPPPPPPAGGTPGPGQPVTPPPPTTATPPPDPSRYAPPRQSPGFGQSPPPDRPGGGEGPATPV